jgi:hypothetical protein
MKALLATVTTALLAGCVAAPETSLGEDGDPDPAAIGEATAALSVPASAGERVRDPNAIDARLVGIRSPLDWQHPRWTLYAVPRRYARRPPRRWSRIPGQSSIRRYADRVWWREAPR